MSPLAYIAETFSSFLSLLRLALFTTPPSVKGNLDAASAKAQTYEEWLDCQLDLDALLVLDQW